MTAEKEAEIANYGMEIASHTYNHVELNKLSQAEIIEELTSSKAVIEELTGAPVISICYPFGAYNDTVLAEAENAGYLIGVTTNFEPTKPEQGRFSLSRLRIGYGCDAQTLSAMLSGFYS